MNPENCVKLNQTQNSWPSYRHIAAGQTITMDQRLRCVELPKRQIALRVDARRDVTYLGKLVGVGSPDVVLGVSNGLFVDVSV